MRESVKRLRKSMDSLGEGIYRRDKPKADEKFDRSKYVFNIEKSNSDMQIAFGYCMVSLDDDGEMVVDYQGDSIEPLELEKTAYNYVKLHRDVGQMHETSGEGCVVESFVLTPEKLKAMGIDYSGKKVAWWVGLYIENKDVWYKVKNGMYKAFSIEGKATRTEI